MAKQSANDSALGRGEVEEVEHHRHIGGGLGLLLDDLGNLLLGFVERQVVAVQGLVHGFDGADALW